MWKLIYFLCAILGTSLGFFVIGPLLRAAAGR